MYLPAAAFGARIHAGPTPGATRVAMTRLRHAGWLPAPAVTIGGQWGWDEKTAVAYGKLAGTLTPDGTPTGLTLTGVSLPAPLTRIAALNTDTVAYLDLKSVAYILDRSTASVKGYRRTGIMRPDIYINRHPGYSLDTVRTAARLYGMFLDEEAIDVICAPA